MYLSRVVFRSRRSISDAVDPYRIHQLLWLAFSNEPKEPRPFLFRADVKSQEEGEPSVLVCLVQSAVEADWNRLKDQALDSSQKSYDPHFVAGERLQFLLRANPTQSRKDRNEPKFKDLDSEAFRAKRGRRVGLLREEEQQAWLQRKAGASGFELEGVIVTQKRPWRWHAGGNSARHDGVDFQGVLRVVNPERMRRTVESGIGAAKGLGFGLLSLARIRS